MSPRVQIVGSYVSPYVRKVLACLNLKGIDYEIEPIVPFMGDDRFTALSPLRRIPVLIDDRVTLPDSSVICQYLEDRYPEPALYPSDVAERARARWLEEYADTRIGEVIIWRLFNAAVVGPSVWGEPRDLAALQCIKREEMAEDCLARLQQFEALTLRTPIRNHRDALRAAGAPLTASTLGTGTPRRGVLRT
jgi:glutathione S-transferase